jgi:uncharacterized protein YjlB
MFQILGFSPSGTVYPIEYAEHTTREAAVKRLEELKKIYDCIMFISKIK